MTVSTDSECGRGREHPAQGASRLEDRSGLPTGTSMNPACLPASNRRAKRLQGWWRGFKPLFGGPFRPIQRGDPSRPAAASLAVNRIGTVIPSAGNGRFRHASSRCGGRWQTDCRKARLCRKDTDVRECPVGVSWQGSWGPGAWTLPRVSSACRRIKGSTCRRSAT